MRRSILLAATRKMAEQLRCECPFVKLSMPDHVAWLKYDLRIYLYE